MQKVESLSKEVIGLIPFYTVEGPGTMLVLQDCDQSSVIDSRKITTVKAALAHCFAVDLKAQAKILRKLFQRCPPLPFYLPNRRVFLPFKLVMPPVEGDSCYGYIEISAIKNIRLNEDRKPFMYLNNGEKFELYSRIDTARLMHYFGIEIYQDLLLERNLPIQPAL